MPGIEFESGGPRDLMDSAESPQGPRRRWIGWAGGILVLALGTTCAFRSCKGGQGGQGAGRGRSAGPVTASLETATKGDLGVYLNALGTVTPECTTAITPLAGGVLTAVHYTEGQQVRKGDRLVDIDPRPYQAQVLQAEGALERDTQLLAQAQMDLERYRAAWARNGINKQLLEDQEKLVAQTRGTVKNDQGTLAFDRIQLGYCTLTAPISGRVGLRLVDPGNVVQANSTTPLAVVTQERPTTVVFTLPEDDLGQVQARMRQAHTLPVEVWDRAQATRLSEGRLLSLDNQIDTTTGTVKLRARFDNGDGRLFPNQFVNTRLRVDTLHDATLVPTGAIQHNGQVAFLYVVGADGIASVQNVTALGTDGGLTAVAGLAPGAVVATSSFEKLQAGSKVLAAGSPKGKKP
jgi:multidrug efflux system membrane fusion protein